jgi:hypothetical protein
MQYDRRDVTAKRLRHRIDFAVRREIKRFKRVFAARPVEQTAVFIFGCQRSGTTMLGELFALDPESDVYAEKSSLGAANDPDRLRLIPLPELSRRFQTNRASLVVAKPLVESQRAADILGHSPRWRAVWLYRDVRDVVLSNMHMFGADNGYADLAPVIERRSDWRSDGLPETLADRMRALHAQGLARHDAAALFWVGRNAHLFAQGLDVDPRVWICRYEDLVADPLGEMDRIYAFLGRTAPPEFARNMVHGSSVGRGDALTLSDEVRALCEDTRRSLDAARARRRAAG